MLEGNNLIEPKLFDNDPHNIALPSPHQETGKLDFVKLVERGATLTLDDGSIYRSLGVVAVNQTNRMCYVNTYIKDGYIFISVVKKEEE